MSLKLKKLTRISLQNQKFQMTHEYSNKIHIMSNTKTTQNTSLQEPSS